MGWFSIAWFVILVVITLAFIVVTVLQAIVDFGQSGALSVDCYMLSVFSIFLGVITLHNLPWVLYE